MATPTLSELHRNITEHIRHETLYQERFEEKIDAILAQVLKTNGRVSYIEVWKDREVDPVINDYKENRAQVRGATKLWTLIWSGFALIIVLTFTLYIKNLKVEIINEVKICCNNNIK